LVVKVHYEFIVLVDFDHVVVGDNLLLGDVQLHAEGVPLGLEFVHFDFEHFLFLLDFVSLAGHFVSLNNELTLPLQVLHDFQLEDLFLRAGRDLLYVLLEHLEVLLDLCCLLVDNLHQFLFLLDHEHLDFGLAVLLVRLVFIVEPA